MVLFIGFVIAYAAFYLGINLLLWFKDSLPVILVSFSIGIVFILALPFIPYAAVYSNLGKMYWGYLLTFFITYTVCLRSVCFSAYIALAVPNP
jgi:hypothetical protein